MLFGVELVRDLTKNPSNENHKLRLKNPLVAIIVQKTIYALSWPLDIVAVRNSVDITLSESQAYPKNGFTTLHCCRSRHLTTKLQ